MELYFPGPYDSPICVFAYWVAVIVSVLLLNNETISRKPSVNLLKRGEMLYGRYIFCYYMAVVKSEFKAAGELDDLAFHVKCTVN